ncbi:hypothetical protein [Bacillus gaemokensis]|uniref:Uncharacterized protein n=1 Tax=Bacillus gaemokensis TaxID=574375 RepID=A0A073KBM8_9BACI|nr:hypothetical protein [Bacillus gaemokensis]KEK23862.1 hypothetical protein BAGA_05305 [Bacillus gaemokensis]KYG38102.1 hypothetical protein AZF08_20340 [Bacillus gaemokensis]
MYYEINVSLKGMHFFATAERSINTPCKLEAVVNVFREKFPESEGFKISVTEWRKQGKIIEI